MGCGCCHRRGEDVPQISAADMDERTALLHTENIWNGSDPNGSEPVTNSEPVIEIETGGRVLSLKERMNALQQNQNCTVNSKIDSLRAERHLDAVKVTASSRDHISSLFADKLERQKNAVTASGMVAAKGTILSA